MDNNTPLIPRTTFMTVSKTTQPAVQDRREHEVRRTLAEDLFTPKVIMSCTPEEGCRDQPAQETVDEHYQANGLPADLHREHLP